MPRYQMPQGTDAQRCATCAEIMDALCAARCSAELAGMETDDFLVRELLLTVIQQLDRAASAVRRLS